MGYDLRGTFLEACDCYVMCPCWFDADPDENECTGTVAWYVEYGDIDGVDVSGLSVVSVSHHGGHRHSGKAQVALFVDDRADDEQTDLLAKAFTGELGGPLEDLAQVTEVVNEVQKAVVKISSDGKTTKVSVDDVVSVSMAPLVGATDRVTTVADSALANVLGTPAEVGSSDRYRLNMKGREFDVDLHDRSANRGRFVYVTD